MRPFSLALLAALVLGLVTADAEARPRRARHAAKAKPKRNEQPPIAFYLSAYGRKVASPEAALADCKRQRASELRDPQLAKWVSKVPCEKERVVVVRGPYKHGDPDDPKVYVYRGSDRVWYDAHGDSPCFVA